MLGGDYASGAAKYITGALMSSNRADVVLGNLREAMIDLAEKAKDDHFYGPWAGGPSAAGGHPADEDTESRYSTVGPDGVRRWNESRSKVHEGYWESLNIEGVPKSDTPTVYMTGGGAASGKTSGLLENPECGYPPISGKQDGRVVFKGAVGINPDEAKGAIPEYQMALKRAKDSGRPNMAKTAASYVHEESSMMAGHGLKRSISSQRDVVYDSLGDSGFDKLSGKVASMRSLGAKRVVANYASIDVGLALARAEKRAKEEGRFVNPKEVRRGHRDVSSTVQQVMSSPKGIFDSVALWDTTDSKHPIRIASRTGDKPFTVHNQGLWAAFVARADGAD